MSDLPKKENLRPDEVAAYWGVSLTTVYRLFETYQDTLGADGLPFFMIRGQYRVKRRAVLAYERRKKEAARSATEQLPLFSQSSDPKP